MSNLDTYIALAMCHQPIILSPMVDSISSGKGEASTPTEGLAIQQENLHKDNTSLMVEYTKEYIFEQF